MVILAGVCAVAEAQAGEAEMQKTLNTWNQRIAEYKAALSYAGTDEEKAKLPPPAPDELASRLWRSVRGVTGTRNPAERKGDKNLPEKTYEFEEEWAAPAVLWFIQYPEAFAKLFRNRPETELSTFAYALLHALQTKHYNSPNVGDVCAKLAESTNGKVYDILEKIYINNSSPAARSCAALAMSIMLSNPELASLEGGYARTRNKRIYYIRQALNLAPKDTMFGNVGLTEAAVEQTYRLRHLSLGSIPPKLQVYTVSGQAVEYPTPGKPHLIFFWSPEEEVGLRLMSKQKALQKQYPGLVIVPIVPHMEQDRLEQMLHENGIDICFVDNEQGKAGIDCRVERIPMAILLDDRSHILYIGYPDMQLQTALNTLYRQEEATGAAKPTPPPAATPAATQPKASNTPPALREMPKF